METTTRLSMDWSNLNFKAKDIIQLAIYIVVGMLFIGKITNAVERISEKTTEIQVRLDKIESKSENSNKENQVFWQSIQNQVNSNSTQIRLLDQRLTMMEQRLK